jgi:predicted hotdog family 3-hydroxylacyl-ACP dehydratase
MTTKSTFQGYVRTYGGEDRNSGVTPGTLIASEVITFLSSTATATAVSVGATVNANAPFVLPQGAIPTNFIVLTAAGTTTTATINFGSAANATSIAQNLVVGARAAVLMTGASVIATGLPANTTVVANVGTTAGTGNVTGVFVYTFADQTAQPGEIGPSS